jgi:DNA repair photolyase
MSDEIEYIPAKNIIARTKSSEWFGADYNMNIYRGCNHGCIYCDSRSACYQITDFDTVRAKADALEIIRSDLERKRKKGVIATGAMSDPYNPRERELELTRGALALVERFRSGLAVATKSDLVARDADLLLLIQAHAPVIVKMSITTGDDALACQIEPGAPSPSRRFQALRALADNGIFCGTLLMPVLPFITDSPDNLLGVVRSAAEHGARFVYPWLGMSLRDGQREHYYGGLERHFPDLVRKYKARYGERYDCSIPDAHDRWRLLKAECDRLGLLCEMQPIIDAYRSGYGERQLRLF